MEAVADEIAQHAAAVVADGFPVAHAQLDGAAFHVPVYYHMAERADGAQVEHLFRPLPGGDLMEVEIDFGRAGGLMRAWRSMARAPARSEAIGFSDEHRLAQRQCGDGDLGLQAGQRGDGDGLDRGILDQPRQPPWALSTPASRANSAVRLASLPASATTSQRASARSAAQHRASVIAADNAELDHETGLARSSIMRTLRGERRRKVVANA